MGVGTAVPGGCAVASMVAYSLAVAEGVRVGVGELSIVNCGL